MGGQKRTRGIDALIAALAERQHGVVAARQLIERGVTRREIERRLQAGRLHSIYRGVYAVGHKVLTVRGHWMAAVLACGPEAVLSHRSAAALWGIRSYSGAYFDITSPSKAKSRGKIRRHHARLLPDEVTRFDGIPVTSPPRTTFDLAAISTPEATETALRQSEFLRLDSSLSLLDLMERHPRHRGIRSVRTALTNFEATPGELNEGLEERFLAFLDAHRLLRPSFNAPIDLGERRYRADCLWPSQRLIAELDSWQAHGTRSSFQRDKSRDRHLLLAGYRTVRITERMLTQESEVLAAELRALLTRPAASAP